MGKRIISLMLAGVMTVTLMTGCGQKGDKDTADSSATQTTAASATENKENVVVKMFVDTKVGQAEGTKAFMQKVTEETGYKIELVELPGDVAEVDKKIDIALMSGDTTDLIRMDNAFREYRVNKGGALMDLTPLAQKDGFDLEKTYGKYLKKQADGTVTGLPRAASIHCVLYNKKIFDDAGVAYPSGAWTWEQFTETAKKLTNKEKGIYGAFFEPWDYFFYTQAKQKGISGYKADGTSNYDDPAFADSLKWFGSLGNDLGVCPSWLEIQVKKIPWDAFMQGKYGMMFIGDWHLGMFADTKTYPRDWKWGVTQTPTVEGGNNNLVSVAFTGVNKNSKNPEAAYQVAKYISLNEYTSSKGTPARVDLSADDIKVVYKSLVESDPTKSVTADDIYKAVVDNGLGLVDEKIAGTATAGYQQAITKNGELYLLGKLKLEEAIANIKKEADAAIAADK